MKTRLAVLLLSGATVATAAGCDGAPTDPGSGREPARCTALPSPGPAPLRRLNRSEYDQTVFSLLGDNQRPARGFPPDEEAGGFDNQAAALSVSPRLAEAWLEAAEDLAERHADRTLPSLDGCAAADTEACPRAVKAHLRDLTRRALRRPPSEDEHARYRALFTAGAATEAGFDPREGLVVAVAALLHAPDFLYRPEFGDADRAEAGVVPLSDHEIATRLAYFLWGTMPDATLIEAADQGALRTVEQVEAQARRLLAAPRARATVRRFHAGWLGLEAIDAIARTGKDPEVYPDFDEAVLPALREEAEAFVEHVVFDGAGTLTAVLSAPYTLIDRRLAAFYGLPAPAGDGFTPVDLDPRRHAGVLTQAGLLAANARPDGSSPVHRGLFVRTRLLCQIPPPPPDVVPEPPTVDPTQTTRAQYAAHEADPLCAGCHRLIDGIGFGFEQFDGLGRFRARESGQPIDASGELVGTVDIDGPFDGAVELAARLAGSAQVEDCAIRQWFRFAHGRSEGDRDDCALDAVRARFDASGGDIREVLVALTTTDSFRYRRAVVPGGGQ